MEVACLGPGQGLSRKRRGLTAKCRPWHWLDRGRRAARIGGSTMPENHETSLKKTNVPGISAEELHRMVMRCLRVNNKSRHKLILTLLVLAEGKLYVVLGHSSIHQYAGKTVGYGRTKTYESLRVARALPQLPISTVLFDKG